MKDIETVTLSKETYDHMVRLIESGKSVEVAALEEIERLRRGIKLIHDWQKVVGKSWNEIDNLPSGLVYRIIQVSEVP